LASASDIESPGLTESRAFQKIWPYCGSLVVAYLVWRYARHLLTSNFREALSSTVAMGASLSGFLLAAVSILVTIRGSWYLKRAKQAGVYESIVHNLIVAVSWCLTIAILSTVGLLFDPRWNLPWYGVALSIWTFVAVTAIGTTIRVVRTFSKFLKLIATEQEPAEIRQR
jgi:hypothetical protein